MSQDYIIHTPEDIKEIRKAAHAAAFVREQLRDLIRSGMSTKDVDDLAGALIASTGGKSAFLGYRGYPGQICISVDDEVVHGIGSPERILRPGDIVSIDVGVNLNGFIGDNAETLPVGEASDEAMRLINATREALSAAIVASVKGNFVRDISVAIQVVAQKATLGIVRDYVGHGCGKLLHEPPEVPNFVSSERGPKLQNGMILAIEPMLNLGTYKVKIDKDGWTVRTLDARLSAHFEHMILINDDNPEILTWLKK